MARVLLEKVSKFYVGNPRAVVDGIDLEVRDREFLVLVGPSGCGKSTTLRMVAGLEEISSGTIRIGERVVNDVPPKDRDIAMVFQNYALYPHMTVFKNMAFGLQLRRRELGLTKERIRERVVEAAKTLGIEGFLERKPKALSGGQRQRVALGRAIVRNPQAFLFDEPLSNLDAKLRVETRAELKRLHARLQTTTIYVTHDQEEAMTLGDRIVVMKDGVIQQCAAPLEVYERPVNRFVAGFVGMPGMNFLGGRIVGGQPGVEGAWYFEGGGQRVRLPMRLGRVAAQYEGREVVLGVRPESLSVRGEGKFAGEENWLVGRVGVVEPLGEKVDVYLTLEGAGEGGREGAGGGVVCRTDAYEFGKLEVGSIIKVHMDLGRVHLFEPGDDGVNITLPNETAYATA